MIRHYHVELADKIVKDSKTAMLKRPVDQAELLRMAGFVQGLQAAADLYEEIRRHNAKDFE